MIKRMRKRPARRPRRKMARKVRSKNPAKTTQMTTFNRLTPKPQIFTKTALFVNNGTNSYIGAGLPITFLGGALAASMPDWSAITALYNRYKMRKVTYTFNLTTGSQSNGLDGDRLPRMFIRYNYDSNLTSANVQLRLQDQPNVKVFQFTADKTSFSYSYYPRAIEPVYLSGISTGYKLAKQQYIDVQYGTVPHYGLMFFVDALSTGLILTYDITWETAFSYSN